MDYHAYYRKAEAGGYQEYYDAIAKAQGIDPQATARTRKMCIRDSVSRPQRPTGPPRFAV